MAGQLPIGSQRAAWFHRYPRGFPLFLFLLTLAATLVAVLAIERSAAMARQIDLERRADEVVGALQRRAIESSAALNAAAALMASRADVPRRVFSRFASDLGGGENYHGALGLGFAPMLTPGEVTAHVAMMRAIEPDYAIRPAPAAGAAAVVPVTFLEPLTPTNRIALGFDMFSDARRREAMERAARSGRPAATGRVRLIQDGQGGRDSAFLIYMPVVDESTQRLRGFVYTPFRTSDFLDAALAMPGARGLDIALYDGRADPTAMMAERRYTGEPGMMTLRPLVVAERTWVVTVADKKMAALSVLGRATLLFGLIVACLVAALARIVTRRALADRQMLERFAGEAAIRTSLTRELNHRVKNTLANVLSIVSLTRRRSATIEEFAEGLVGRVRALSATHDLLSQTDWTAASIADIVRSELAPYMTDGDAHVSLAGPDIRLAPNDAMSLGLALHELATNAAKYGALMGPEGHVHVAWKLISSELAEVTWRESGGPTVVPPQRRGFGRDLIEKIVASELKNAVELTFEPEGVRSRLRVPVRHAGEFVIRRS
ncbi:CHASE domain-containing protein [Parablastomonas sp. CN1-191]|uniref:CHASE domain-containing protein n=1 Tax=Parablastomonas sp. CN1-191 TaxID=3400908 RepID=UPI003BF80C0C